MATKTKGSRQAPATPKQPEEWTTGDEPMTASQASYLRILSDKAGVEFDPELTKAEASRRIQDLQATAGLTKRTGGRTEAQQSKRIATETNVKKVSSKAAPHGEMEQTYLVSGKRLSMRLWRNEEPQQKTSVRRAYETVGYVISGRAELEVEGQIVKLEPGDSWLVPAGAEHAYRILKTFTAVEATSPPAEMHGRDAD